MRLVPAKTECCDACSLRWNRLFDVFVNGVGWQRLCAGCDPDGAPSGTPRPYRGRYPIRSTARLTVIEGGAR